MARSALTALLGALPAAVIAQMDSAAVADSATAAVARATELYRSTQPESRREAVALFRSAAAQYGRSGNPNAQAEAIGSAGTVLNALGFSDTALAQYRDALDLYRAISNRAGEAAILSESGEALLALGAVDSALIAFRGSLAIATELHDSTELGYSYSNLGTTFKALGRLDSALVYLDRALRVRETIADTLGMGVTLNNLSTTYQALGRYDASIVVLRRSLVLRRAVNNRAGEGTTLNNLGYSFEFLDRDSALTYYREALPILEETGRRSTAAITLGNMGRVFLAQAQPDSAEIYLRRSVTLSRETGNRAAESWAANDLGRLFDAASHPDSARIWYSTALSLQRGIGDRRREGETLQNLASHHRAAGAAGLAVATAYFDSAAAARSEVGGYAGGDANRVSFQELDTRLYDEWALAWLGRSADVGGPAAAYAALAAAERGRAQALLELVRAQRRRSALDSTSVPTGFAPGADLAREGEALAGARGSAAAVVYLATADTLVIWFLPRAQPPIVYRVPITRDSLAELVRSARAALRVDAGSAEPGTRSVASLDAAAAAVRPPTQSAKALEALRQVVLPNELLARLQERENLLLVPQGVLALVPFAALPMPPGSATRALGNAVALRYAPSLALLQETAMRPRRQPARRKSALVVGNPRMPFVITTTGDTIQLPPLPGAGREARDVARRLGTTALTGTSASEATVRSRLGSAQVVHLATHGYAYASERRARESFVALAPGTGTDGLLTVGELLDDATLSLIADLVVLSACQTGLGDLKQAEGTVGLQRAFLARGARSVLVSQWSVSDVATERLMASFYRHWTTDGDHPGHAESLRRAQVDVATTPGLAHPRFWAGFQLVGAD